MSTHWRKILESEYLSAADLDDGTGKFVPIYPTIKFARSEDVLEPGTSKKEQCLVAHFKENYKPMIVNVTNAKAISKSTGSQYIEGWANKRIGIGTAKVKAFGEIWDALRVDQKPPPASGNQMICADCGEPIKDYQGVTAAQLSAATAKKYGRSLCYDCSAKIRAQNDPLAGGGEQIAINP